jgi:hypothetical protein
MRVLAHAQVAFELPGREERLRMINLYMNKFILAKTGKAKTIVVQVSDCAAAHRRHHQQSCSVVRDIYVCVLGVMGSVTTPVVSLRKSCWQESGVMACPCSLCGCTLQL